jgi:hypothetical protein
VIEFWSIIFEQMDDGHPYYVYEREFYLKPHSTTVRDMCSLGLLASFSNILVTGVYSQCLGLIGMGIHLNSDGVLDTMCKVHVMKLLHACVWWSLEGDAAAEEDGKRELPLVGLV